MENSTPFNSIFILKQGRSGASIFEFLIDYKIMISIPYQQYLNHGKAMMERSKSLSYERACIPHRQDQNEYIKICVDEEIDNFQNDDQNSMQARHKYDDKNLAQRFTFNKHFQDTIKEEDEEEFYKVDYDQIIELRKNVKEFKTENLRLMQQSAENMQLFNNYMKEMEQRLAEKNKEIDTLKNKIRILEQKCEKSQDRAKRCQLKMINELNLKNLSKRDSGVQCEIRTYKLFQNSQQNINTKKQEKKDRPFPDCKDIQIRMLEKENHLMQREITQLKDSHRNLAQSFQKEIQLRKIDEDYDSKRNIYYRTLTNSPRISHSKNSNSIVSDTLKLQFKDNSTLNALISPRNNSISKNVCSSTFEPNFNPSTSRHQNLLLNNIDSKLDKLICQSTCMQPPLQFDRAEGRRYAKKGRP